MADLDFEIEFMDRKMREVVSEWHGDPCDDDVLGEAIGFAESQWADVKKAAQEKIAEHKDDCETLSRTRAERDELQSEVDDLEAQLSAAHASAERLEEQKQQADDRAQDTSDRAYEEGAAAARLREGRASDGGPQYP